MEYPSIDAEPSEYVVWVFDGAAAKNPQHDGPFAMAVWKLRSCGYSVQPSDVPGLTIVDGIELTINQVFNVVENGWMSLTPPPSPPEE